MFALLSHVAACMRIPRRQEQWKVVLCFASRLASTVPLVCDVLPHVSCRCYCLPHVAAYYCLPRVSSCCYMPLVAAYSCLAYVSSFCCQPLDAVYFCMPALAGGSGDDSDHQRARVKGQAVNTMFCARVFLDCKDMSRLKTENQ